MILRRDLTARLVRMVQACRHDSRLTLKSLHHMHSHLRLFSSYSACSLASRSGTSTCMHTAKQQAKQECIAGPQVWAYVLQTLATAKLNAAPTRRTVAAALCVLQLLKESSTVMLLGGPLGVTGVESWPRHMSYSWAPAGTQGHC